MTDRIIPNQIIEREFRKAVNDQTSPMQVEVSTDDEVIQVWYRCATYSCACESDEEFAFFYVENPQYVVRFPIPADWYEFFDRV
jgi:hypothetical protein